MQDVSGYLLEEDRAVEWAARRGHRRLLIQAPDGVKRYLSSLVERLEEEGFEVVLSGSHAWGGCDLALREAEAAGADALIHVGHHGPVRFNPPPNVLFIPGRSRVDVVPAVEEAAAKLAGEEVARVAVLATVQHVHALAAAARVLEEYGVRAVLPRSPDPYMCKGLVTGCDVRAAEAVKGFVDAFLVVGGGTFHALGVALATGKAVVVADPYAGRAIEVEREARRVVAVRLSHLSEAMDAREAVVVASIKPGQRAPTPLDRVRKLLRERGVRSRVLIVDDVERGVLEDYGVADLYVNTACPRLATDDYSLFPGPVVNLGELPYVFAGSLEGYEPGAALRWAPSLPPAPRRSS